MSPRRNQPKLPPRSLVPGSSECRRARASKSAPRRSSSRISSARSRAAVRAESLARGATTTCSNVSVAGRRPRFAFCASKKARTSSSVTGGGRRFRWSVAMYCWTMPSRRISRARMSRYSASVSPCWTNARMNTASPPIARCRSAIWKSTCFCTSSAGTSTESRSAACTRSSVRTLWSRTWRRNWLNTALSSGGGWPRLARYVRTSSSTSLIRTTLSPTTATTRSTSWGPGAFWARAVAAGASMAVRSSGIVARRCVRFISSPRNGRGRRPAPASG